MVDPISLLAKGAVPTVASALFGMRFVMDKMAPMEEGQPSEASASRDYANGLQENLNNSLANLDLAKIYAGGDKDGFQEILNVIKTNDGHQNQLNKATAAVEA